MGRVRGHTRFGALLALAALALQLVLSFGHIHIANVAPVGVVAMHGAAVAAAKHQAPAQTPSDDDDYCTICASIYLVSTSMAAQPPALPVPVGSLRIKHPIVAADAIVAPRRLAFRSRAPPTA